MQQKDILLLLFIVGAAGIGLYIGRVTHPKNNLTAAIPVAPPVAPLQPGGTVTGHLRPKLAGQIV